MSKKMYSFKFSQEGLVAAKAFKEENKIVKYAPVVITVIALAYVIGAAAPAASMAAGLSPVQQVAEAFKLGVTGGAI